MGSIIIVPQPRRCYGNLIAERTEDPHDAPRTRVHAVPLGTAAVAWRQLYKNRSSRKIDSQRLFSREYDFPKTFSLTQNPFSGKTYFYTIHPCRVGELPRKDLEGMANGYDGVLLKF